MSIWEVPLSHRSEANAEVSLCAVPVWSAEGQIHKVLDPVHIHFFSIIRYSKTIFFHK